MTPEDYGKGLREAILADKYVEELKEDSRRQMVYVACANHDGCHRIVASEFIYKTGYCSTACAEKSGDRFAKCRQCGMVGNTDNLLFTGYCSDECADKVKKI